MQTSILRPLGLFSVTIFYLSYVARLFFNKFILYFFTSIVSALLDNIVPCKSVLQSGLLKNMTMLPGVHKTLPLNTFLLKLSLCREATPTARNDNVFLEICIISQKLTFRF